MSRTWAITLRGIVLAATLLVAFPASSVADTTRIKAVARDDGYAWNKDFVSVDKGDKVVWKNPTGVAHTVTFYKGPGPDKDTRIAAGERTSKTFRRTGAYYYRCKLHSELQDGECSGMCGHVHVS
jgi:plastocyanin